MLTKKKLPIIGILSARPHLGVTAVTPLRYPSPTYSVSVSASSRPATPQSIRFSRSECEQCDHRESADLPWAGWCGRPGSASACGGLTLSGRGVALTKASGRLARDWSAQHHTGLRRTRYVYRIGDIEAAGLQGGGPADLSGHCGINTQEYEY